MAAVVSPRPSVEPALLSRHGCGSLRPPVWSSCGTALASPLASLPVALLCSVSEGGAKVALASGAPHCSGWCPTLCGSGMSRAAPSVLQRISALGEPWLTGRVFQA